VAADEDDAAGLAERLRAAAIEPLEVAEMGCTHGQGYLFGAAGPFPASGPRPHP